MVESDGCGSGGPISATRYGVEATLGGDVTGDSVIGAAPFSMVVVGGGGGGPVGGGRPPLIWVNLGGPFMERGGGPDDIGDGPVTVKGGGGGAFGFIIMGGGGALGFIRGGGGGGGGGCPLGGAGLCTVSFCWDGLVGTGPTAGLFGGGGGWTDATVGVLGRAPATDDESWLEDPLAGLLGLVLGWLDNVKVKDGGGGGG